MDFLNRAYGQVSDLFRSMTPGSRITAGLLLSMIVISLTYLFVFQVNTGDDFLFGAREFSESELAAMETAFAAAKLDESERVGHRIRVPRGEVTEYLQALSDHNFTPVNFDTAIDEVLSGSNSWWESKQLRDLKYKHAIEKQLGLVLSAIAGIENATVHFRENRKGGYPPVVERKVTVAVAAAGGRSLDPGLVRAVRTTACGWFGLQPDDVTVTDLLGRRAYVGKTEMGEHGSAETVYADTKLMLEELWRDKIYGCLSMYPGVIVGVNVELDADLSSETRKVTIDPQPTAVESDTLTKSTESKPAAGGRPGAVPNEVPSNAPREVVTVNDLATSSEETSEKQKSLPGHEEVIRTKAPLVPRIVTASVSIPKSYFQELWEQQNPATAGQQPAKPDPAELKKIEDDVTKTISNLVVRVLPPLAPGDNPYPQVEVTSYADLPAEPVEEPALTGTALAWLADNWQTIGLLCVGLVSLWMLRSMIHAANSTTPAAVATQLPPATETEEPEEESEEGKIVLPRHGTSTGPTLRDELSAMVKEDPDAAANVLRTWIGDAA